MRGLLSLMLAIPLAVGCGGGDEDDTTDDDSESVEDGWGDGDGSGDGSSVDGGGSDSSGSDCITLCDRAEGFWNRCAPEGTTEGGDAAGFGPYDCFESCIYLWDEAHERGCLSQVQAYLDCVAAIDWEGVDCPEGEYEPPYIFCRTENEAIWDCAEEDEDSAVPEVEAFYDCDDEEEDSAAPEDVAEDGDIK